MSYSNLDEYVVPVKFQKTFIHKYVDDMKKEPRGYLDLLIRYTRYTMNTIIQFVYSFCY